VLRCDVASSTLPIGFAASLALLHNQHILLLLRLMCYALTLPGMNPYLEHPDRWSTVHNRLIVT